MWGSQMRGSQMRGSQNVTDLCQYQLNVQAHCPGQGHPKSKQIYCDPSQDVLILFSRAVAIIIFI